MSERVTMPALGESVTEGTVTRWLKSVGDRVEVDEPLLEVSTDKVDTEIPSPVAGHPPGDPRPGGRHRAGRRGPRGHRRRRRAPAASSPRPPSRRPREQPAEQAAPAEQGPAPAEQAAPAAGAPASTEQERPPPRGTQHRAGAPARDERAGGPAGSSPNLRHRLPAVATVRR